LDNLVFARNSNSNDGTFLAWAAAGFFFFRF